MRREVPLQRDHSSWAWITTGGQKAHTYTETFSLGTVSTHMEGTTAYWVLGILFASETDSNGVRMIK